MNLIYFVPGKEQRYINRTWKKKITIGNDISHEGYYIGKGIEKERCWIFYGKPYIPSKDDIPSHVNFDPNLCRKDIVQSSIQYFLVQHKKSDAYFIICRYFISLKKFEKKYFSDLLTFINGKWKMLEEWPFKENPKPNNKIMQYWEKYGNYYEEDFQLIMELKGV